MLGPLLAVFGAVFIVAGARVVLGMHEIGSDEASYATHVAALVVGCVTLCAGLLAHFSRASILVRNGDVIAVEHLGPFVRRHAHPSSKLSHFMIKEAIQRSGNRYVGGFGSMVLHTAKGPVIRAAHNYPIKLLDSLGAKLSQAIGFVHVDDDGYDLAYRNPEIIASDEDLGYFAGGLEASVRPLANGISLILPPLVASAETNRSLSISLLFLGVSVPGMIATSGHPELGDHPVPYVILGGICACGLLGLHLWWRRMYRRAAIDVQDGHLKIRMWGGMFGQKTYEWEPGNVDAVTVESAMLSWDDGSYEIKIKAGFNSRRLFRYRHDHELPWLAKQLREALGLPEPAPS